MSKTIASGCASFCTHDPAWEHGPQCESGIKFYVDAVDEAGCEVGLYGSLIAQRGDAAIVHNSFVCVTADDTNGKDGGVARAFYLSEPQARSVAAGLVYLAESLERPARQGAGA